LTGLHSKFYAPEEVHTIRPLAKASDATGRDRVIELIVAVSALGLRFVVSHAILTLFHEGLLLPFLDLIEHSASDFWPAFSFAVPFDDVEGVIDQPGEVVAGDCTCYRPISDKGPHQVIDARIS